MYSRQKLSKRILFYIIIIAILCVVTGFYHNWRVYQDDAYISLRYVLNLSNGCGFSWNCFEYLEGYTNFLWIIILFLMSKVGFDLVSATKILGTLCYSLLSIHNYYFTKKQVDYYHKPSWIIILITFMTVTSVPLIGWSLAGLEVNLYTLLLAYAIGLIYQIFHFNQGIFVKKNLLLASIILFLAILTRPEAIIIYIISLIFVIYFLHNSKIFPNVSKVILLYFIIPFFTLLSIYLFWKYSYFGSILPNTYYAKSYNISYEVRWEYLKNGLCYLKSFFLNPPWIYLSILIISIAGFIKTKNWSICTLYLCMILTVYCLYVVYIGGDFMVYHRFLVPMIPILFFLFMNFLIIYVDKIKPYYAKYFLLIMSVFCVFNFITLSIPTRMSVGALSGHILAPYIQSHWAKNSKIALSAAGSLPYLANDYIYIDMIGLNDKHIARRKINKIKTIGQEIPGHLKGDGDYVLSQNPDYIFFYPWGTEIENAIFLTDTELNNNPIFHKKYQKKSVWLNIPAHLYSDIHYYFDNFFSKKGTVLLKKNKIKFTYYQLIQ